MDFASRAASALAIGMMMCGTALAQTAATTTQRDANQQQRIEQGLKSGELTTGEAARLEKQQTQVEKMQKNALKDGTLTPAEQARLRKAQNAESASVYREKHDARTGNPNSASSKRMQADVQRNANQQERIAQGAASGQLTNKETAKLERGQSHVTAREAHAGADGHVGPNEQARIQASENRQSAHVYNKKHNAAAKP